MKQYKDIKQQCGLSAVELLFSLSIMALMTLIIFGVSTQIKNQISGETVAIQTLNYAKAANRYLTAHYVEYQNLLSDNGVSNNRIITIPVDTLIHDGFINNLYPKLNQLKQSPCLVITWSGQQIQSLVYYRTTNNSKSLSTQQLHAGMGAVGSLLGVYKDSKVYGAAKDWGLTDPDALFIAEGYDPSAGKNPQFYTCTGDAIANNSYVANLSVVSQLKNKLPSDTSLHQYTDDTTEKEDDLANANVMLDDLNMHYKKPNSKDIQSNIMFQSNPNCVMNPDDPDTMKDSTDDPKGCKDKQLAFRVSKDDHGGTNVLISGFQQGGDEKAWERVKTERPWVGNLAVESFQPTAHVNVGTACTATQLGTMAQQQKTTDASDVNNLYVSQVQCMVNPLCPPSTGGICYMPISSITIRIMTPQNPNASVSKLCPVGMFISDIDADSAAYKPAPCKGLSFSCHVDDCHVYGVENCSQIIKTNPLASKNPKLYQGFYTSRSRWYQGCPDIHLGCNEGFGEREDTYIVVRSITCTNDITQAGIEVQGDRN